MRSGMILRSQRYMQETCFTLLPLCSTPGMLSIQARENYLLGNKLNDFSCLLEDFPLPEGVHIAREEAISFAMYRVFAIGFELPGRTEIWASADELMNELGF